MSPAGHGVDARPTSVASADALRARTVGVLGGGQLGRMFVHAAQSHGLRVVVLEPDPASPAAAAADIHLQAPYTDVDARVRLASLCAAATTEFENVPAQALRALAAAGCAVAPPADAVETCQHREREKHCFVSAGVPCAPFRAVDAVAAAEAQCLADMSTGHGAPADGAPHGSGSTASPPMDPRLAAWQALLPGILKTATLGYDGKGQRSVRTLADLHPAWVELGAAPCVLERRLPLRGEVSVIVARGRDGASVNLPLQQNLHRGGVLAVTQVPAPDVDDATAQRAVAQAHALAETLGYVGVLCVEFFVLEDGTLVANEMAPRPHNSGHYSIDACDVSQFDLQLRTLLGWPLVPPRQHSPAVMLNLMGDLWFEGTADDASPREPRWADVLALPGAHLHLYGKSEPRRGRKMGHLTVTAADASTARTVALRAAAALGLPAALE